MLRRSLLVTKTSQSFITSSSSIRSNSTTSTSPISTPTDHQKCRPAIIPLPLQLVECPRDAMQGITRFIPTKDKIRFINAILKCGFHTVDCGSFVSPKGVPQMADTAEVLEGLDVSSSSTRSKLLVIVANLRGTQMACEHEKVSYIGYPLSISETFQNRNTRHGISDALVDLGKISEMCAKNDKHLVTYISMAFGNPYGEPHSIHDIDELIGKVAKLGCQTISLADTVGVGTAALIREVYTQLIPKYSNEDMGIRLGGHFHSGVTDSCDKVRAAYEAGCTRLDGAVGGMGGCPFAKDSLVGNMPTIAIINTLEALGVSHGIDRALLEISSDIKHDTFGVAVKELVLAKILDDEVSFCSLCRRHFDSHDTRGGGDLDVHQFGQSMLEVFGELGERAPSEEKILKWFRKLGELNSNDGVVTFDEYIVGARYVLTKRLKENKVL